ncbi:MAG: hypothetical protein ACLFWD_10800 [Anaerolineales bacterium]
MAKTKSVDRIKIAALLIFVAAAVVLVAWTIWDGFSQADAGNSIEEGYQAAGRAMITPTSTEVQATIEPMPTDPYPMENQGALPIEPA